MNEKLDTFRQRLGGKRWFRVLSDRVFGKKWLLFLLGIGSIPFFLPFIVPGRQAPAALAALGALCYGLNLLGQLILSLDPYEQQAGQHQTVFLAELLVLPLLLIARQLGFLEQLTRILF